MDELECLHRKFDKILTDGEKLKADAEEYFKFLNFKEHPIPVNCHATKQPSMSRIKK